MYKKINFSGIRNTVTAVLFTVLSFTAHASNINVRTEAELRGAILFSPIVDTITLIDRITLTSPITIDNGQTFTLNTNGHTLDFAYYRLTIDNGSNVTFDGCGNFDNALLFNINNSKVVFNGDLVVNDIVQVNDSAEVTINGNITADSYGIVVDDNAKVTVNGNITSGGIGVYIVSFSPIVIVNGTITAGDYIYIGCDDRFLTATDYNPTHDNAGYDDYREYKCNTNDDNSAYVYVLIPYVAEIGTTKYTLDDALLAVTNGDTIRLIKDITLSTDLEIDNGIAFTLNTNGYTLDFDDHILTVSNESKVTFHGTFANIDSISVGMGGDCNVVFNTNLVSNKGLSAYENADVTVNGNILSPFGDGLQASDSSKIRVNGDITAYHYGIYVAVGTPLVVLNGTITANDYIVSFNGSDYDTLSAGDYNTLHDNANYENYLEYKCFTSPTDSGYVYVLDPAYAYAVTVEDDGNGMGTASPSLAVAGTTIHLSATATSSGYVFDRWEVIAGGVSILNDTFTMPAKNVTVKAHFKQNVNIVGATPALPLQVYPNPTNSQLRIENYEVSMGEIQIIDVVGRVVVTHCNASLPIIDISHLEKGLYFLKIGNKTMKIIKN